MPNKYLLLGGSGYVGTAFQAELTRRAANYCTVSRHQCDYTSFKCLVELLREFQPTFLINCAGSTGKPNVDACETVRAETLLGNVTLPQTIAHACEVTAIPWGHVSSGCIYAGAKLVVDRDLENGAPIETKIELDLMRPDVQAHWTSNRGRLQGFAESDPPNFSFRSPPCSFYSGTKALGEEVLASAPENYVWRLRIPFDGGHSPRNYLSKICNYPRVYDNANSLSHRSDFARACVDSWEMGIPYGTYNVTNPGWITTRDVAAKLKQVLNRQHDFSFFKNDDEFYASAATAPRSNTILDTSKLLATGVQVRTVDEALAASIAEFAAS